MSGHLSQKDIFEADEEVWKNKKSKKAKYIIWDASNIDSIELDSNGISLMATKEFFLRMKLNDQLKGALVASDATTKSLVEEYIRDSIGWGTSWWLRQFDDLADAEQWVGIKH